MGADLAMEQASWRRPPPRARWDGDELVVEQQRFYWYDWVEVWRGPVNQYTEGLLKALGLHKIPDKPVPCDGFIEAAGLSYSCELDKGHEGDDHVFWLDKDKDYKVVWSRRGDK